MSEIETAFFGAVGRPPELRQSKAGKPWAHLAVVVGKEEPQWLRVAVFGETAELLCRTLQKGDRVYCEGRLTASIWQPEGQAARVQLDVAAWKCEKIGQIGRSNPRREKPRGDYQRPLDDDLGMRR
jgi:single-stranded DNA-binding protein